MCFGIFAMLGIGVKHVKSLFFAAHGMGHFVSSRGRPSRVSEYENTSDGKARLASPFTFKKIYYLGRLVLHSYVLKVRKDPQSGSQFWRYLFARIGYLLSTRYHDVQHGRGAFLCLFRQKFLLRR